MSSSRKPSLRIDWCSYEAAKYAVQHWHYSRSLPCSKTARLGVWEDDKFIGVVIFAWGANRHLAGEYRLKMTECAELYRVALDDHATLWACPRRGRRRGYAAGARAGLLRTLAV